jgi:hypothetical protein
MRLPDAALEQTKTVSRNNRITVELGEPKEGVDKPPIDDAQRNNRSRDEPF